MKHFKLLSFLMFSTLHFKINTTLLYLARPTFFIKKILSENNNNRKL